MSTVVVRIDDEASWPPAVKHLLERHLRELAPNGAFRESACPSLVDAVVGRVRAALDGHKLLCCHCTRLTPDEVDDVRRNGLRPLSRELCETKLRQRVAAGDFTESQARWMLDAYLRRRNDSYCTEGRIWAVLGRSALRDEDGLGPPLAWWGGEALLDYIPPERHYRVGQGCIVEFLIREDQSRMYDLARAFLDEFLFNRGLHHEDGASDVCITDPVPPSDIRRVVTAAEPLFEEWTGASAWVKYDPFAEGAGQA